MLRQSSSKKSTLHKNSKSTSSHSSNTKLLKSTRRPIKTSLQRSSKLQSNPSIITNCNQTFATFKKVSNTTKPPPATFKPIPKVTPPPTTTEATSQPTPQSITPPTSTPTQTQSTESIASTTQSTSSITESTSSSTTTPIQSTPTPTVTPTSIPTPTTTPTTSPSLPTNDLQVASDPILIQEKIKYQEEVSNSVTKRLGEKLRNYQPHIRAFLLSIPTAIALSLTHDFGLYTTSLVDALYVSEVTTKNYLMSYGAFEMIVAFGLFQNAIKIMELASQPDQKTVQTVIKDVLHHPGLKLKLGENFKLGHFVSISTRKGPQRFTQARAQHYQQWLENKPDVFTQPIPELPVPKRLQQWLSAFPAFQTVSWNAAISEKIAQDMKQNPDDYLIDSEGDNDDDDDESTSDESDKDVDSQGRPKTLAKLNEIDGNHTSDDVQSITPTTTTTNTNESIITNWGNIFKPDRIQFSAHLIGQNDEGLLLCEVEKENFGPSFTPAKSHLFTNFKVFQFVSIRTGQSYGLDIHEQPSFLSKDHVKVLVDNVPKQFPIVSGATFDHILVEDKHKEATKQFLLEEKKKTSIGIYH